MRDKLSAPSAAAVLFLLAGFLSAALASCAKEKPVERIDLPPTPVLTLRSNWGVIRAPFLRLREEPLQKARIVAHLRRGSVLEILSRTGAKETIENDTSYWFQVNYGGLRGWVFGAYLEIFDSRNKAESYARELE